MLFQFRHQPIVVHGIEELGKNHLHHVLVPVGYVPLGLLNGLMRLLPGTKSVAEFRESRIEVRGQNLSDGLLDYSVLCRRDAQHSCASVRLGDVHALDCGGYVLRFAGVCADARSEFLKVRGQAIDGHPVYPCGTLHACSRAIGLLRA